MTEKSILEILKAIKDPATGQDIVRVGMAQEISIDKNSVNLTLSLPSLNVSYKSDLSFACITVIQSEYPGAEVNIHFKAKSEHATDVAVLPHIKNIIAVASGKGGVGKSTISTNLALGLQALGAKVGLLDADLYGPSIPTMLGLQGERPPVQEIYGQHKIVPLEKYGLQVISIGNIIEPEQAVVLRGPRLAGIIKQFFLDCLWEPLDYLVVDLPPGTGDIQLTMVQTVPLTAVVIVTTPQEVAVVDAVKAMNMFQLPQINVPILGVVENMTWFTPEELPDNKYYIFGKGGGAKLAQKSNSMLLGQIPIVQSVREGGDSGRPAILNETSPVYAPLKNMAENVARQLAVRNELIEPTKVVHTQ